MKKNIIKIIGILLVVGMVVFPFSNAKADELQKGELRCPSKYNGNACIETKDASGKVISVTITESKDGYTVRKTVSKTDVLGEYNVKFEVDGTKTFQTSNNAYVMLIIDGSSTMGVNYSSKAVPAAKSFAKILNNASTNIYIAFDSFHNRIFASRNFQAANLDSANFGSNRASSCSGGRTICYVGGSEIYKAFNDAYKYFKNINGKKYIIILGDGKYKEEDGDFGNQRDTKIGDLKTVVDAIYSVKYGDNNWGKDCNDCLKRMMQSFVKSPGYYVKDRNMANLTNVFNAIAEEIKNDVLTDVLPGYVVDNLGSKFSLTNEIGRKKILDSVNISNNSFNIKIDASSETGWHETNAGFSFNYDDGELTSNINPEVYWEQEKVDFNSCSDILKIGSSVVEDKNYYRITCEQGWIDNNTTINGFEANLTVNGLSLNSRKFNIVNGQGFPLNLDIKNNVRCTYEFDALEFQSYYNSVNSRSTNNDKELALKEKELLVLNEELDSYISISKNATNLENYKDRYNSNSSTKSKITVKYKNSSNLSEGELIYGLVNSNISCDAGTTSNVLGKNVITKRVCTMSIDVNMKLRNTCLNMKDGEQIECGSNYKQELDGGNKFYSLLDESGGYVSVLIERADFFGSDIRLDGEKRDKVESVENPRCEFNNQKISNNLIYRQIDLSDPFVKKYNQTREIGKNWLDNKFNFQNIINPKIWSDDNFKYKYQLSKTDVENIRKTTISGNERVESYLGNDCYFDTSDKYVCSFVGRNQDDNNLFTYVKVND